MKKLFKPACLLFNILTLILFFFIGLLYAGWIEAGKNQGLAAGAIVLGYGVIFGFAALILSFFITYNVHHKHIVKGNIISVILILTSFFFLKLSADKRREKRNNQNPEQMGTPTEPVNRGRLVALSEMPSKGPPKIKTVMGLGFFKPKLDTGNALYFFGNPSFDQSVQEHGPTDSIVFKRTETGFQIASAPPWLMPEHMKWDYDLLYFKVLSIGEEFIRIEGNKSNGYSTYTSRWSGDLIFWPQFLLGVHSIELKNPSVQKVRIKPLENASIVNIPYDFMKPTFISESWAKVLLLDSNHTKKGEGWIRWKKDGQLLVSYSLLS